MKAKIFTLLVLGMMFSSISLCNAQNILYDGDFSTTTIINPYIDGPAPNNIWFTWQNLEIKNNVTVEGGVCKYDVASLSAEKKTDDIQLIQAGFPLIQGHSYRLSFDVKADTNRTFGLFLGENGGSWTSLIGYDKYVQFATTDWKTITIDFVVTNVFSSHKISFELGAEQIVTYFDNVMLIDMGIATPSIGILGTSLFGWDIDVVMQTLDGISYTLSNHPLIVGSVKFRQDYSWSINWGSDTFPLGIGIQGGPNIPILSNGNYDISFNRLTGDYSFACVSNCDTTFGIIGIIGDALNGWVDDVDMQSKDGINFILKNYTFKSGEAKFRQDNSWSVNWGSNTFPTGKAVLDGLNIPITAGTYDVTFNIVTGDYSFVPPSIGVLGTALIGWNDDIDLQSTDGITYTLKNYYFNYGEVKFRQDNSWDVNWGAETFPTGIGSQNGSNIPIPAGNYDVTFIKSTGEYNFTLVCFPTIQCPSWVQANTDPGKCGAVVNYPDVIADVTCGDEQVIIKQTAGLASGSFFPIGNTWNAFEFTNSEGKTATCGFYVNVIDPPQIKIIPDLWPPNHKMVPINLEFTNNCDGNITVAYYTIYNITSNEPDNGLGDGDMANDWQIDMYGQNLLLRAERSGKGIGRIYTFNVYGWDEAGNWFDQIATVSVPHDKGKEVTLTTKPVTNQNPSISDDSIENVPLTTTVWPNPSTNSFNLEVQSNSNEKVILTVFDPYGRLLSNQNANSNQITTFGKDLKAGTYLVLVRQGNNSKTIKVVKQ